MRKAIYVSLGFLDSSILRKKSQVIILSYHSVSADGWRFSVAANQLKKQIAYLKKQYTFITLAELQQYILGKKQITTPSAVISFDDGYKDILQMKAYFQKQNIRPVLFLLADSSHANWKELGCKRAFLTDKEIRSLVASGWEIGSHSSTHANLATLTKKELIEEVYQSKKKLEKRLGMGIPYFAYPRGKYTKQVVTIVKKAGYVLGLTMDDGIIQKGVQPLLLPRIGVDNTHSFREFTVAFSPSVIAFRQMVKQSYFGRYL